MAMAIRVLPFRSTTRGLRKTSKGRLQWFTATVAAASKSDTVTRCGGRRFDRRLLRSGWETYCAATGLPMLVRQLRCNSVSSATFSGI